MTNPIRFTFSDTVAGYVTAFETDDDSFGLRTSDGREYRAHLTATTSAEVVRNLGAPYRDVTAQLQDMLVPGRYVQAYGIFYPRGDGHRFEVTSLTFPVARGSEYVFEQPGWWVDQARAVADFYLRGQFPDGDHDWRNYRTTLSLSGTRTPDHIAADFRQETDTISRLVYGLATAYLLTGVDRFLDAAESGTQYLRDHMRATDESEGIVYWYHGIDVAGTSERKVFASTFGDDHDAIPMYEQIYALAGPTQTYRATGDPRILDDIERTVTLFNRYFFDPEHGGYFSHIDPVTFDARADTLGRNRARKNWNSVGDHAPAYLINAVLATGRKDFGDMLLSTADTVVARFADYADSPFVQERFHQDWSADEEWGWQRNHAVVGHNLKIAWNLVRIHNLRPKGEYLDLARHIANLMPGVGSDQQRGGWYDVVERVRGAGEERHHFVWHDRKAWWQQEQAILAYLVLAGTLGEPEYRRHAREAASFYNAKFLDHDEGGVYFNVLASGIPYLLGQERLKGSHAMSGYHSIELCYLAAVYTNLLLTKDGLTLHFRPGPDAFGDGLLRVAPDLLPPGSVRIAEVLVDDQTYPDFDADGLTVALPRDGGRHKVRVRLVATSRVFEVTHTVVGGEARIQLRGRFDDDAIIGLREVLERVVAARPRRIVLDVRELADAPPEAVRSLLFARQKLPIDDAADFLVIGASPTVRTAFAGVADEHGDFVFLDQEPPTTPDTGG